MERNEPWEPPGEVGGVDIPVQGAAVGQLLGLIPVEADNGEALDQGKLGVLLSYNKTV